MTAVLNRNIITQDDIKNLHKARESGNYPRTLDTNPPAGQVGADLGGVSVPTEDDYITKLLKYVPIEILGAYLFMQSVVNSNVTTKIAHAQWLLGLLIGAVLLVAAYDRWALGIVRVVQILVSMIGLAIYIFALGGWFATTTWYHGWYASIALPLFAILISIIKLGPLPTDGGQQNQPAPLDQSSADRQKDPSGADALNGAETQPHETTTVVRSGPPR